MSHFTVLVVGKDYEKQLEPFNEGLEMEPYVEYTKEQLIQKEKDDVKRYAETTYAEYLKDPDKYRLDCVNPGHMEYIEKEFPKKLNWTDEEFYKEGVRLYDAENIGENGEVYSSYNPKSKWDWYKLGGRWAGFFKAKEGAKAIVGEPGVFDNPISEGWVDQIRKGDIDWVGMRVAMLDEAKADWSEHERRLAEKDPKYNPYFDLGIENGETEVDFINRRCTKATFALLMDGHWYEHGKMGWWGIVHDEKANADWDKEWQKLIDSLPDDTLLSVIGCHI